MNRLVACLCMCLLPVCVTVGRAQGPKPHRDDAAIEKVVVESMEAGRKMEWKKYAHLIHPESLHEYQNMWLPVLKAATKERPEKQADLLSAFDNATDLKTLMSLKPKEFFLSSMKGMASQLRGLNANSTKREERIIGTVREGDDQAYVVVRTRSKFDGAEMTRVEVVALKRSGTEWKMMLPDSVRIMAETFNRMRYDTQKSGPVQDRADPDKEDAAKREMKKLQGTWRLVSEVIDGEKSDLTVHRSEWVFRGDHVTLIIDGKEDLAIRTGYRLLPSACPKGFDLMERDDRHVASRAIYSLEGVTLTMAHFSMGEERPKDFRPTRGTGGSPDSAKKIIRVFRRAQSQ